MLLAYVSLCGKVSRVTRDAMNCLPGGKSKYVGAKPYLSIILMTARRLRRRGEERLNKTSRERVAGNSNYVL